MNLQNKNIFIVVLLISMFGFACDENRVYEQWVDFEDIQWHEDSLVNFDMTLEDSLVQYDLRFGVRNTNAYAYENLWLLMSLEGPFGIFFEDTVQLTLAKNDGAWLGKRSANLYTSIMPLYRDVQFYKPGDYTLRVRHGMRSELLEGIASVGFRIEKTN